jgi:metal-responsive CopG/Arc/MetJ family transcriptional regulator
METQNITLSLPKSALRKVKLLAAKRNSSISRLVTDAIEKMLAEETNYEKAKERQIALMRKGFDLGWQKPETRDELHER